MSQAMEAPPAYLDNVPASGYEERGPRDSRRNDRADNKPQFDVKTEMRAFYAMLEDPTLRQETKRMLPSNISLEAFIRTAKTAVQANPTLLFPPWRPSLMRAIYKAAAQGLLPDGKHGALMPRYDHASKSKQVCWQPMVWGITQLGRRAGALKKMVAHIVFEGEEFEVLGGTEDCIRHKINPAIAEKAYAEGKTTDAFLQYVAFAYCIIVAPDGTTTWRYMTRSRIARVRTSSEAKNGPWAGPFADEMILKTVILFTAKHIDTDGDTPEMQRFREAMETDLDAEFGEDGAPAIEHEEQPSTELTRPALAAPSPKLANIEEQLKAAEREKVAVQTGGDQPQTDQPAQAQQPQPPAEEKKPAPAAPTVDARTQEAVSAAGRFADAFLQKLEACKTAEAIGSYVSDKVERLEKLRTEPRYREVYGRIVGTIASQQDMMAKVGGELQSAVPWFYDDIVGKVAESNQGG